MHRASAGDAAALNPALQIKDCADGPHHARPSVEPQPLPELVDGFNPGAMRSKNLRGPIFAQFSAVQIELLVGGRKQMEPADGGLHRRRADNLPGVLQNIDDPRVTAPPIP